MSHFFILESHVQFLFQSLFWWNDLMSSAWAISIDSNMFRFNPCSGGMTL